MQLWVQVLIAMAAGVLLGHYYPEAGKSMQPFGDGFIKLIRMLIAPIVFCTVVLGIAKMGDMSKVGKVAIKALIYFEVMTTVALVIAMVIVNAWRPGAGMNVSTAMLDTSSVKAYVNPAKAHGTVDFLLDVVPNAMVGAFAEGHVLQVLLISVLMGSTLVAIGPRARPVMDLLDVGSEMLFRAVAIVMYAAPSRSRSGAMARARWRRWATCSCASTSSASSSCSWCWDRCAGCSASASSA